MMSVRAALKEVAASWQRGPESQPETVLCSSCHETTASWRRRGRLLVCLMCVADGVAHSRSGRARRRLPRTSALTTLVLTALLSASQVMASGDETVHVHDGDTLSIAGQSWRLWGVDAPELTQFCWVGVWPTPCGASARDYLSSLVSTGNVRCARVGRSYGRSVGRCDVAGKDVAGELVRAGYALDYREFSGGAYAAQEHEAKTHHRGIWRGSFVDPWRWRQMNRRPL